MWHSVLVPETAERSTSNGRTEILVFPEPDGGQGRILYVFGEVYGPNWAAKVDFEGRR
jgi:hypothetical protein